MIFYFSLSFYIWFILQTIKSTFIILSNLIIGAVFALKKSTNIF